jgi:uncharacterized protein (DUF1501 family)
MNQINRRSFIKNTLAGLSLASADTLLRPLHGISKLAFAQSSAAVQGAVDNGPLIVVFQRGAADGLAMLSPLDDQDFKAARPPEMRFTQNESRGKIESATTNFYWHPQAGEMAGLYESKKLLVWQAVGIMNETRSHFEAQEMVERGVNDLTHLPDLLGWMARENLQNALKNHARFGAVLYGGSNHFPRAFLGESDNISIRDLQSGINIPNGDAGLKGVLALAQADFSHPSAQTIKEHFEGMSRINRLMPKGKNNKVIPYASAGKTEYSNNDPCVGLRSLARLLVLKIPVQYAWIDHLGWDTHENQPGRLNNLTHNLGHALLAFAQDMEARKQSYTLVVMTEFGRRLRSNRSNGTDHGHAGLAMVMGDRVPGGQLMGRWPGLGTAALDRQVDLAVTTDYRDLLRQAKVWHSAS